MEQPYSARRHEEMKDVLMDTSKDGPSIHYYMIRGGKEKTNITTLETGFVGGEYIKTYGHYHVMDFKETYNVIQGQGILLTQNRKKDQNGNFIDDEIQSFQALRIKAGDSINIPSFAGHLLVNTGDTWLVTSDNSLFIPSNDSSSMPKHADYTSVKNMHGFAYYVINENGKPKLVKNPKYKVVPTASIV